MHIFLHFTFITSLNSVLVGSKNGFEGISIRQWMLNYLFKNPFQIYAAVSNLRLDAICCMIHIDDGLNIMNLYQVIRSWTKSSSCLNTRLICTIGNSVMFAVNERKRIQRYMFRMDELKIFSIFVKYARILEPMKGFFLWNKVFFRE